MIDGKTKEKKKLDFLIIGVNDEEDIVENVFNIYKVAQTTGKYIITNTHICVITRIHN